MYAIFYAEICPGDKMQPYMIINILISQEPVDAENNPG